MPLDLSPFFLFGTALLLGLRHGIDWDHIAAISDITSSAENTKQSIILGTLYALGHGAVIIILGMGAVLLGVRLPDWFDSVMQPFVGITLILLGCYLFYSIIKFGQKVKMRSRWMLIINILNNIYGWIENKITHKHIHSHFHYPDRFGIKTAIGVGIIHGIGAETPTQLLLFTAAAGAGGSALGSLLVFIFVLGLVLSNSLIIILSVLGIAKAQADNNIYLFLAGITAVFSFIVGVLFLTGHEATLPAIFGG